MTVVRQASGQAGRPKFKFEFVDFLQKIFMLPPVFSSMYCCVR